MQRGDALQVQTVQSQTELHHYNVLCGARCITNQHNLRIHQKVVPQENVNVLTQICGKNWETFFYFVHQINGFLEIVLDSHINGLHNILQN